MVRRRPAPPPSTQQHPLWTRQTRAGLEHAAQHHGDAVIDVDRLDWLREERRNYCRGHDACTRQGRGCIEAYGATCWIEAERRGQAS